MHEEYADASDEEMDDALANVLDAMSPAEAFNFGSALSQIGKSASQLVSDPAFARSCGPRCRCRRSAGNADRRADGHCPGRQARQPRGECPARPGGAAPRVRQAGSPASTAAAPDRRLRRARRLGARCPAPVQCRGGSAITAAPSASCSRPVPSALRRSCCIPAALGLARLWRVARRPQRRALCSPSSPMCCGACWRRPLGSTAGRRSAVFLSHRCWGC